MYTKPPAHGNIVLHKNQNVRLCTGHNSFFLSDYDKCSLSSSPLIDRAHDLVLDTEMRRSNNIYLLVLESEKTH